MPGIDDITPDNNDYVSRPRQSSEVPVVKDGAKVEDPIDGAIADGDVQLGKDDFSAIPRSLEWC